METLSLKDGEEPAGSVPLVRSVRRAAAILRSFAGRGVLSLTEVSQLSGLDKGTTRRLLLTLASDGLVVFDAATQRWGLGGVIRDLANSVADGFDVRAAAGPVLAELAADLKGTIFLSVYQDGRAVCLERIHDITGMEVRWWQIGGTLPINCGGAPKLLLSYQDPEEIARVLPEELTALTPKSITDRDALLARLEKVRAQGWELAVDDVALGLSALAVPVFDRQGRLVCAVSAAGLTPQMVRRGRPVHLERLLAAARAVAERL